MKIRCVMMFKNEDDLLGIWARYHGGLFGMENLYLLDNGSTSPRTLELAAAVESEGGHVDRTHGGTQDFLDKGKILAELIQRMDADDPADFYFPLDCDEFLGVTTTDGDVLFDAAAIDAALMPFKGYPGVLSIQLTYQNIPGSKLFRPAFGALPKVFFARGACRELEHGFHSGATWIDAPLSETPIIHVHYHHKPLQMLKDYALQKLRAVTDDLSDEALAARVAAREPGWHLVDYLTLRDDADYAVRFENDFKCRLPNLELAFRDAGLRLPFDEANDIALAPPQEEGSGLQSG